MIQMQLQTAILFYVLLVGAIMAGIWVYTEMGARRSHRRLATQYLWRCTFCRFSYLDESGQELSECPRCGSINSLQDPQARVGPIKEPGQRPPRTAPEPDPADAEAQRRNPSRRKRPHQRRRGPRRRR